VIEQFYLTPSNSERQWWTVMELALQAQYIPTWPGKCQCPASSTGLGW